MFPFLSSKKSRLDKVKELQQKLDDTKDNDKLLLYKKIIAIAKSVDEEMAAQMVALYDNDLPNENYIVYLGKKKLQKTAKEFASFKKSENLLEAALILYIRLNDTEQIQQCISSLIQRLNLLKNSKKLLHVFMRLQQENLLIKDHIIQGLQNLVSLEPIQDWKIWLENIPKTLLPEMSLVHFILENYTLAAEIALKQENPSFAFKCLLTTDNNPESLEKAIDIAKEQKWDKEITKVTQKLGEIYFTKKEYQKALNCFEQTDNREKMCLCHYSLRNFIEALNYISVQEEALLQKLVADSKQEIVDLSEKEQYQEATTFLLEYCETLQKRNFPISQELFAQILPTIKSFNLTIKKYYKTKGEDPTIKKIWYKIEKNIGLALRICGEEKEAEDIFIHAGALAESIDDYLQADQLFSLAGDFGSAIRVLGKE